MFQISGIIARCLELDQYPTLDQFFSIYRLNLTGVQVYFDAKDGSPRLVTTPTLNSGWHSKWAWYEGCELRRVSPWHRLCPDVVKSLGNMTSVGSFDLTIFRGVSSRYKYDQFADVEFLCSHCCKD